MELDEFFERITESYNQNIRMTQIIKSDENNKRHTKWMLKEMELHNSNLDKFVKKYSNMSSYTQNKYYYDLYLLMMEEIKRVRDQSVEFMSVSEKEKYYESFKNYDISFKKEINEVLNIIKNPDTHIPINKPNQGCLLLFILPPLFYILNLLI